METNSNAQANHQSNNEVLSNIQSFGEIFSEEEQRLRKQYALEKIMAIMEEYEITMRDLESDI